MLLVDTPISALDNENLEIPGGWPRAMALLGRVNHWSRGDVILRQGIESDEIHIILFGKVLRHQSAIDGACSVVDLHSRGDLLGVTAILDEGLRSHTVVAHTRVVTFAVPVDEARRLIARNSIAREVFYHQLARRVRHDAMRATALAHERVEVRLRRILCDFAERFGVEGDARGTLVELGLTRGQLAGMTGTALETVIRTINSLRDRDLLVPDGRRFFIPDVEALAPRAA